MKAGPTSSSPLHRPPWSPPWDVSARNHGSNLRRYVEDLLLELATDQLNVKTLAEADRPEGKFDCWSTDCDEVQAMRLSGYRASGEPLPNELVWPWKGCFGWAVAFCGSDGKMTKISEA